MYWFSIYKLIDYNGSNSLYEFINSFKKSNDLPYPDIRSETTKKAMRYLKKMKDDIGEGILNVIYIYINLN